MLTGVIANISLARIEGATVETVRESLKAAQQAASRAKSVTQQLLTFSKGGAPVRKTASVADLLRDTVGFALSGSNVRCEFSLPEDLWAAEIDEGQIGQVIENLVVNADQAMPQGGTLTVSAENVTVGARSTGAPPTLAHGLYVHIRIADHGIGIPREHLAKVFDPYFTTKEKGSGLGLAVSYSIVKKHGGHIDVESEVGAGTTFTVHLPACEKPAPKMEKHSEDPARGNGRVLVMDDEEVIRRLATRILTHLGYEAESAADGAEALETYRRAADAGRPFSVVVMDLTIPGGMGGKEAVQKLLEMDPKAKAIVSSGYSTDAVMSDHERYGFRGMVGKPYNVSELGRTLHEVIAGPPREREGSGAPAMETGQAGKA